jgi:hypothetical protein
MSTQDLDTPEKAIEAALKVTPHHCPICHTNLDARDSVRALRSRIPPQAERAQGMGLLSREDSKLWGEWEERDDAAMFAAARGEPPPTAAPAEHEHEWVGDSDTLEVICSRCGLHRQDAPAEDGAERQRCDCGAENYNRRKPPVEMTHALNCSSRAASTRTTGEG